MQKFMHKLNPCVNRGGQQRLIPTLDLACKNEIEQLANGVSISIIVRTTKFPEM
jgi:hypothetical protein